METKVYARTVKKKKTKNDPFMDAMEKSPEVQSKRQRDRIKNTPEFVTIPEQVAKSTVFVRNWYLDEARKLYPYQDRMKRIDKYFPYAQGGPIMVDETRDEEEAKMLYLEKAPMMKTWGHRYIVIELGTETPTDLYMALDQLGAV